MIELNHYSKSGNYNKGGFMAGGLIEGIKKCYTGNNVFTKHAFLIILELLISFPTCIATISTNGKEADVYLYMFFIAPFFGIVSMLASIALGYYMVMFIRNSLKFCHWKETEKDEEKIRTLQIMPEVDSGLFNINIFKWLAFCIIWMLIIGITVIILGLLCLIPVIKILAFMMLITYIMICMVSMPYIFCNFIKEFNIEKNINPLLMFKYLPKILTPTIILDLKYFGLIIGTSIIGIIAIIIFTIGFYLLTAIAGFKIDLSNNIIFLAAFTTIYMYICTVLALAYYYAIAHIYYENIEKAPDENQLQTNKEI